MTGIRKRTWDCIRRYLIAGIERKKSEKAVLSKERIIHKSKFRQIKAQFEKEELSDLNSRVPDSEEYAFGFKGNDTASFSDELMIFEKSIPLDSKGTGTQIFVKVDFVLSHTSDNVEVILIEEPENHLSHMKLID